MSKLSIEGRPFGMKDVCGLAIRHRLAMADLVLGFASLDTHLSNWMVEAFQMRSDRAALLLQHMSISTKYRKLILLFDHEGQPEKAKWLKKSKNAFEIQGEVRNLVCHAECIGVWRAEPDLVAFVPLNYVPGLPATLEIELRSLKQMEVATKWAAEQVGLVIDAWTTDSTP